MDAHRRRPQAVPVAQGDAVTTPDRQRSVPLTGWEREMVRARYALDVLWEAYEWALFYGFTRARHDAVMAHLREPARLP